MPPSSVCQHCQHEFSALRIGFCWPTSIPCAACRTVHGYRFGHLIGLPYLTLILAICLAANIHAHRFSNVSNGIHSTSGLQLLASFGGAAFVGTGIAFLYGSLMKKCCTLRAKPAKRSNA